MPLGWAGGQGRRGCRTAEMPFGAFLSPFRKPTAERVPSTARARGLLPALGLRTHIWKPSHHDRRPPEAWALDGGSSAQGPRKTHCP